MKTIGRKVYYRIWCDHPESDFHGWISDLLHKDRSEAERELKMHQDTNDLSAEFEIREVHCEDVVME